ncbi:hypothetical protein [Sinorhizobium psoraleae]|uniref:Uncharacterized protein n=1 Tax=Sinorhizobium psoraleae TaxID=520838 RepID=A0ABT4KMP5_9HYPH|nr:hypothetical protein [Sinorhizobium psoraleae]MCZ4093075.1 hypothetical protein [Sinorhizobium psoraleae]
MEQGEPSGAIDFRPRFIADGTGEKIDSAAIERDSVDDPTIANVNQYALDAARPETVIRTSVCPSRLPPRKGSALRYDEGGSPNASLRLE